MSVLWAVVIVFAILYVADVIFDSIEQPYRRDRTDRW